MARSIKNVKINGKKFKAIQWNVNNCKAVHKFLDIPHLCGTQKFHLICSRYHNVLSIGDDGTYIESGQWILKDSDGNISCLPELDSLG